MDAVVSYKESGQPPQAADEIYLVQNPGVGAVLIWKFIQGYKSSAALASLHASVHLEADYDRFRGPDGSEASYDDPEMIERQILPVLPLVFLVLPIIFNKELTDVIGKTFESSGLRLFSGKLSSRQDAIISIHSRMLMLRKMSLASLSIATEAGLVSIDHSTALCDCAEKPFPRGTPASIKELAKHAKKLGTWCGSLSIREVQSALRVKF